MDDSQVQNAKVVRIAVVIAVVLAIGAGAWWYLAGSGRGDAANAAAPAKAAVAAPTEPAAVPAIEHPLAADLPVGTVATTAPVDNDTALRAGLRQVLGETVVANWIIDENIARRLVATVDNLDRNARTEQLRPLRPPGGPFVVRREPDAAATQERIVLDARNFARYDGIVDVLARLDMTAVAAVYVSVYGRLQQEYENLGYPQRYFNDRLVAVIDHLLQTPEPAGPVELLQPKVLYQFAAADLEQRSAGQKLLLRMGSAHTQTVKQKLRDLRAAIARKE